MSGRQETSDEAKAADLKGFDDFDLLLGDIMRGERATLGKSLLDVQRELKIKATYIAAIENTDPSAFETPGFIAGYVRSYARYLGLDPEWAFKTFCREGNFTVAHGMSADASVRRTSKPSSKVAQGEPGKKKPAHLRDPFTEPSVSYLPKTEAAFSGVEPRAIGSVLVLVLLISGLGYGGWSVLQEVQKVQFAPVEQTPDVLAELDPLTAVVPVSTDEGDETSGVELAESTTQFDRLYRPEALELPVMIARDGPIASIDPASVGALAQKAPEDTRGPRPDNLPFSVPLQAAATQTVASEPLESDNLLPPVQVVAEASPGISLFAVRPSWVRVRGADGTIVFEKILDAGEKFDVPVTENPPTLRAGNAGSLYFTVAGQTYGPVGDGPAVVKDVLLDSEVLTVNYAIADASGDSDLARFVAVAEAQAGTTE